MCVYYLKLACPDFWKETLLLCFPNVFVWREEKKYPTIFSQMVQVDLGLNCSLNTWGRGQQAQSPLCVLQQVDFPGHDVDLSHLLLSLGNGKAGTLLSHGITVPPARWSHVEAARLQMVPWGQQCRWSSQHTACRTKRQCSHDPHS